MQSTAQAAPAIVAPVTFTTVTATASPVVTVSHVVQVRGDVLLSILAHDAKHARGGLLRVSVPALRALPAAIVALLADMERDT